MYYKRLLKMPFFITLIVILPFSTLFINKLEKTSDEKLHIGLFFKYDEYSNELSEKLKEISNLFLYENFNNEDDLKNNILNGNLHCGYVFDDFFDKENNCLNKEAIKCIKTKNSVLSSVSDEAIFSAISTLYGYMPAVSFKNDNQFSEIKDEDIKQKFSYYVTSDLTYSFIYEIIGKGYDKNITDNLNEPSVFPIRGIGAILIMLSSIFGVVRFQADEKKGLHKRLSCKKKFYMSFLNIFSLVSLGAISVFISIIFSGTFLSLAIELLAMILYIFNACMFGMVLAFLIKKTAVLISTTPLFTIGAFILCPVFVNIETIVPFASVINKLFIPYSYLCVFYGKSFLIGIITLFLLCCTTFLLYLKENN